MHYEYHITSFTAKGKKEQKVCYGKQAQTSQCLLCHCESRLLPAFLCGETKPYSCCRQQSQLTVN